MIVKSVPPLWKRLGFRSEEEMKKHGKKYDR